MEGWSRRSCRLAWGRQDGREFLHGRPSPERHRKALAIVAVLPHGEVPDRDVTVFAGVAGPEFLAVDPVAAFDLPVLLGPPWPNVADAHPTLLTGERESQRTLSAVVHLTLAHLKRERVSELARVDGDPARALGAAELLEIVFVNLLVNAAYALQGRGTIHVSLASITDLRQMASADEGPGIPADVLEKLFTPFFTTTVRGSGLGLPTVRRLIEAHHGAISIACPSAGGTVVTVQLPGARLAVTM